jgi:hypothetical protein
MQHEDVSLAGETYPAAVIVCAIGFFLRIFLSNPVLNMLGINYGSEDAGALSKIHPGSYLILISFFILLCSRRSPVEQLVRVARQQTAFFTFFAIYIVIMVYWALRGPKGIGMIPDIHIVMPITAIVFSYAPRSYARFIAYTFAAFAVLNSAVGLCEAATHLRIFPFDPDWEVLKQDYFRASAFLGHPLTNAGFTSMALFVVLGLRMPLWVKSAAFLIMLCSLVAFGGRSALIFTVIFLMILGIISVRTYFRGNNLTVLQIIFAVTAVICVPLFCLSLLYVVLHSEIGARLMAYSSGDDDSAGVRFLAFQALDYMTPTDILFGMDGDQITQISLRVGVMDPTSDIENAWILMFMFLGIFMFPLWLGGLAACLSRLMTGASPALKIAVVDYFFLASTSNSFGRKDPIYAILAGIIVCAKHLERLDDSER